MSPVGKACYERATTNAQLRACAGAEYQRQDSALSHLIGRIRGEGLEDKRRLPALEAALKRWRDWRDAECAARADMVRGGSAAPRVRLQCLADLAERQIRLLKEAVE